MSKIIRLRLGDTVDAASNIFDLCKRADEQLGGRKVKHGYEYHVRPDSPEDRRAALEILYYIESSPAWLGLDGCDMTERSACVRTAAAWRKRLGLAPHEGIPTPESAL